MPSLHFALPVFQTLCYPVPGVFSPWRKSMFDKVLILSASAGAGHLRAADAIEKAFAQAGAAREVRNIDVLDYTNKVFRHLYSKAYLDMVTKMPDVMGWL